MSLSRMTAATALSLALSAPATAQPAAQTIQVWSFGFAPSPIYLRAGQSIRLTFQNSSGSSHDFTAKEFFAAAKITGGSAAEGEVELKGHETKSVTLIPRRGTYHAHCSHFMHSMLGMHATIIVS